MKVFLLIPLFIILNSCSSSLKNSEYLFNKTNLDNLVKLELKGEDFLFTNFIDQSDTISIRCFNVMNGSGVPGLPIKISWTHRSGSITILSDENGFINFKPEVSFSNNAKIHWFYTCFGRPHCAHIGPPSEQEKKITIQK